MTNKKYNAPYTFSEEFVDMLIAGNWTVDESIGTAAKGYLVSARGRPFWVAIGIDEPTVMVWSDTAVKIGWPYVQRLEARAEQVSSDTPVDDPVSYWLTEFNSKSEL